MEDEWEAEVHDFVRNRLDEADLASEEVMDSAFSEDWEVAINEMRGNVFAPLLKEMNYIRDILRFLSGHQATIKEAYSSIGDIDTLTSTSESAIDKVSTMMGEGNIGVVDSEQIRQQLFSGLYSESPKDFLSVFVDIVIFSRRLFKYRISLHLHGYRGHRLRR